MLADTYPLWNIFLSVLYFMLIFLWIFILIQIIFDIFRSHDLGGGAKALWFIFILFLPFLGVFVYLIARGGSMHQRQVEAAKANQAAMDDYIKQTASSGSTADELAKLADLKKDGHLSDAEYEAAKAKLLA